MQVPIWNGTCLQRKGILVPFLSVVGRFHFFQWRTWSLSLFSLAVKQKSSAKCHCLIMHTTVPVVTGHVDTTSDCRNIYAYVDEVIPFKSSFCLSPRKQDQKVMCFAKFSKVTYTTYVKAQFCVFCRWSEVRTVPDETHWCVVRWQRTELLFRTYPVQMKLGLQNTTLRTSPV
jgi:hypothetical protein